MKRVGTGEARIPGLRNIPDTAAYLVELLIIAASYAGVAELGQFLPALNYTATPCWPPTGFALALVLLCGYRIWPAILLGSLSSSALVWLNSDAGGAPSVLAASAVGIGTVLAALAGAWLINRWSQGCKTFATLSGIARFALIAFVPTAMTSSVAAIAGLILADGVSPDYAKWATWWLADAAGTLLVTPTVVLWATMSLRPMSKSGMLEAAAVFILASAIGTVAFSPVFGSMLDGLQPQQNLLGFLVLLPLTWAALRGNQRNAATAALIFCGSAIWGLSESDGAFSQTDLNAPLLLLALSIGAPLSALAVSARHRPTPRRGGKSGVRTGPVEPPIGADQPCTRKLAASFPDFDGRHRRLRHFCARHDAGTSRAGMALRSRSSVTPPKKSSASISEYFTGRTSAAQASRAAPSK